jgi:hypothetical protein
MGIEPPKRKPSPGSYWLAVWHGGWAAQTKAWYLFPEDPLSRG